ncbi:MAG TPA: lysylphosphatidylglycerol synthase transmembrane domain-containing protein [Thermoanaerobaculia bacterium]
MGSESTARVDVLEGGEASVIPEVASDDPTRRRSPIARWASVAALFAVLGLGAGYLIRNASDLAQSVRLHPLHLVPLVLLEASLLVTRGLLTRSLCRIFGVSLGAREAFHLAAATSLTNYVAPFVGGTGLRAVYLKRRHRLPYASFVSVQAATYTLHFAISATTGLLCLPALPGGTSALRNALAALLFLVLVASVLAHWWPFRPPSGQGTISRSVRRVIEGWIRLRASRFAPLIGLLAANTILQGLAIAFAFAAVGTRASPIEALFVASIYSLSIVLAITPASVGISEGAVVLAASVAGLPSLTALMAAVARRVVAFSVALGSTLAMSFGNGSTSAAGDGAGRGG